MPIVEALAEKGHQVTVITPFSPDNQIENVKEIETTFLQRWTLIGSK